MAYRFRGGVHPPETKLTADDAIVDFPIPKQVLIPVQQHIGAPAQTAVKVGDVVRKGQVLARAGGFVSTPVHASIGGTVKKIAPHPQIVGVPAETLTVEGNGDETWAEGCNVERDVSRMDAKEIRDAVLAGGLAGMGGATFPTHVKLSPPANKPIDTFIVNGVECEPWLTADDRLMVELPGRILDGADILRRALGCSRCIIGIEENKPRAIDAMTQAAAERDDMTVLPLHVRYPQGAEKQLIYAALRREVPSGGLPMDVGVVVQNVGTCLAADDAVRFNRPLIDRIVTVTGDRVKTRGNFRVRVGTLVSEILEHVGVSEGAARLLIGGPMMGLAQASAEVPFNKGTSGIVVLADDPWGPAQACIRCGRCVDACPEGLTPSRLSTLLEADLVEEADAWNLNDCIECGCCTYVCPSRRPIVQQAKYGKAELRKLKAKK